MRNIYTKFAYFILSGFAVICLYLLAISFKKYGLSLTVNIIICQLFLISTVIASVWGIYCRKKWRINLSLVLISLLFGVYVSEIFLSLYPHKGPLKHRVLIAKEKGVEFNEKTGFETAKHLNKQGDEIFLPIFPDYIIRQDGLIGENGNKMFPLGGLSETKNIFGNESGVWTVLCNDEHGFNNPPGLYNTKNIDIVLLGDSFTHGYSVKEGEDIGSRLREFGRRVLNLGNSAFGPLLEFATFKEYAVSLKPKIVLWLYSEQNDISNLEIEMTSSLLMGYLNGNFTQDLATRQNEIDKVIRSSYKKYVKPFSYKQKKISGKRKLFNMARLKNLRLRLTYKKPTLISKSTFLLFKEILRETSKTASSWGGKLYFVYLPAWERYRGNINLHDLKYRDEVLNIVRSIDIPIIDMHKSFTAQPDPLIFFPFRYFGHYNKEGYAYVAKVINKRLNGL